MVHSNPLLVLVIGYFITLTGVMSLTIVMNISHARKVLRYTSGNHAHQMNARFSIFGSMVLDVGSAFYFTGFIALMYMVFIDDLRAEYARTFLLVVIGISYAGRGLINQFLKNVEPGMPLFISAPDYVNDVIKDEGIEGGE